MDFAPVTNIDAGIVDHDIQTTEPRRCLIYYTFSLSHVRYVT